MIIKILKKVYKFLAYIRHPFRITCLDCGFLAASNQELITAARIELRCRGRAGCPPLDGIRCFRSLWVELDLIYRWNYPEGEGLDEVNKSQRECRGFFKYKAGWSPSGHQELLSKSIDRKKNLVYSLITGFLGGMLAMVLKWLATLFGFIS